MSTTSPEAAWPRTARPLRRTSTYAIDWAKANAPLGALLVLAAVVYLWGLSRNGYANSYYAAAVQAGTHSWKAFLFGSLDAANHITVDKPPASLWLMELSTRLFGFSSFSMLLPEALAGVASLALLYATVRRWFGRPAALLSCLILAITPVAALMFRFNNPDALLVLLLIAAAYAVTRAVEAGRTRWLVLAGSLIGFAFLTKMLQAFLVLPAFTLVYLVAAPVPLRRRIWQLGIAGLAMIAAGGWWVALVELWPASARPYVGGSTNNSILELIFGWNGLDRLSGGGTGVGAGAGSFSGTAGMLRLFNAQMGGEISWLLPAAVIALVAGAVWTARRPRTDRTRAALMLWGGWLVVTALVFSFMTGVIHPYYTNMLAPAIAVLAGVGTTVVWGQRERVAARVTLATILAATATLSYVLLDRTASWLPWLRFVVLAGGLLGAAVILLGAQRLGRSALTALAVAATCVSLAGPLVYTLSTVSRAQTGSTPSSGPASAHGGFTAGGGMQIPASARAHIPKSILAQISQGRGAALRGGAAMGGEATKVSSGLASLLEHSTGYEWSAATTSASTAASLELASDTSVMSIGGFTGTDNSITLAHFKQLVAEHKIHYYVVGSGIGGGATAAGASRTAVKAMSSAIRGGGFSGGGAQGVSGQIETWVSKHFKSTSVGGMTAYDLTQSTGGLK